MGDEVATLEELQAFERTSPESRQITPALKGILTEIANTGVLRYNWRYLQSLILFYIDQVIVEYDSQSQVEVGPARPRAAWESPAFLQQRLKGRLADQFPTEAPFTIQRIAELLLEPHKHYTRLNKLVFALERLIVVTTTLPTDRDPGQRPKLSDFGPVNCNPKPVHVAVKTGSEDGHPNPASGSREGGYGLASSFLAVNSGHPEERPELEEAMGHLNEAGLAADVAAKHPPEQPPAPIETVQSNGRPPAQTNGHSEYEDPEPPLPGS